MIKQDDDNRIRIIARHAREINRLLTDMDNVERVIVQVQYHRIVVSKPIT